MARRQTVQAGLVAFIGCLLTTGSSAEVGASADRHVRFQIVDEDCSRMATSLGARIVESGPGSPRNPLSVATGLRSPTFPPEPTGAQEPNTRGTSSPG